MRRILIVTVVALGALSLAGCSSSTTARSGSVATAPDRGAVTGGTESDAGSGSLTGDSAAQSDPESDATSNDADRSVVTTGTATVTAENPVSAADRAASLVVGLGGRVDDRQQQAASDGDRGSASVTLRVPANQLESMLDSLGRLGTIEELDLSSADVTRESQDLDARITASKASVERLLVLVEKASTTKDLIALESAISDRQGDLESMEAEQRSLADQVALSTVAVSFVSPADAPAHTPQSFWSGLGAGWSSFVTFLAGTLVLIGVALPWLGFAAVVAAVVFLVVRLRRRAGSVSATGPGSSPRATS